MLENLAARVREDLKDNCNDNYNSFIVRLALITCAAALAHHGLLDNIDCVNLVEVDLSTVPAQHLVSLISNVTRLVYINYVIGCDLLTLIDSVKCKVLLLFSQCLGREETKALVRSMESGVERVRLFDVDLDMETLLEFSGRGKCRVLEYGTTDNVEKLKTWAIENKWRFCDHYRYYHGLKQYYHFYPGTPDIWDRFQNSQTGP